MKALFLLLLSSITLFAVPAAYRVPIFSGYDLLSGQASYSVTTNLTCPATTNLSGYWYQSNYNGNTTWQIPAQQFFNSGASNIVVSFNLLSTNGPSFGANGLAGYVRVLIYTNMPLQTSETGTPTNVFVAYYDSGDKIISGIFRNGTNIQSILITNSIATNLLSNTNIAFGVVSFNHQTLGASAGSIWLLNGRMVLRP